MKSKILNYLTLKLMEYQVKKADKLTVNEENTIIRSAYENMSKSYQTTCLYLKSNKK